MSKPISYIKGEQGEGWVRSQLLALLLPFVDLTANIGGGPDFIVRGVRIEVKNWPKTLLDVDKAKKEVLTRFKGHKGVLFYMGLRITPSACLFLRAKGIRVVEGVKAIKAFLQGIVSTLIYPSRYPLKVASMFEILRKVVGKVRLKVKVSVRRLELPHKLLRWARRWQRKQW